MTAQKEAPAVGAARGEVAFRNEPGNFIKKRRPAYSLQFHPDENGFAVVCVGWPPVRPPAKNVLALPPDASPAEISWGLLKGFHALVQPTPGASAPHGLLRELGAELVAAGAESLTIFDGTDVVADWWRAGRPKANT